MKLFPFLRFTVHGHSMLPTLKPGQDVLVLCWFYKIKIGDLVMFRKGGKQMLKRVKKMDGEWITVVGDNDKMSTDSRIFGPIQSSQIIGKVIWYQYPSNLS